MSEDSAEEKSHKRKVGRSPAYPILTVNKALEKTKALYDKEREYAAPLSSAMAAWDYSPKSSGARQTLATLRYYGLVDVLGDGDARKVKVSDTARRILLDQREDQTERRQLIRRVALTPAIHKTLYDKFGSALPSDASVEHFLVFEEGFNQSAAKELLAEYKETAKQAGLHEPPKDLDKVTEQDAGADGEKAPSEVELGDRVQWTSQGVDQFPNGALIIGFSEDGEWAFTDMSGTGVPIRELTILETPSNPPPSIPPNIAAALAAKAQQEATTKEVVTPGTRKAVFPLDDGDVSLIFPENISADGLMELGQYLNIFLKRERKKKEGAGDS